MGSIRGGSPRFHTIGAWRIEVLGIYPEKRCQIYLELAYVPRFVLKVPIHGYGYAGPDKNWMILLGEVNVSFERSIPSAGFFQESCT
jgi:hypothetical protein